MTTTPETPAIASKPPATRDGAGKPKAPIALERWVPIASWLSKYKRGSSLTPDLIAAISVGAPR
jgi:hypothetical protein